MKYLALIAVALLVATSAFAELSDAEKRKVLEAAREKMEMARVEFEVARRELGVDISVELEIAREAMDAAAEVLAGVHIRGLGLGQHKIIELSGDHHIGSDGRPQLGLIIGVDDNQGGVKLIGVTPGSGAQKAGLAAGDRVLEINGTQLEELKGEKAVDSLVGALEDLEDGDLVNLVYESDGKVIKTEVAATSSKSNMWSFLGELGNIDLDMDFDLEFLDDVKIGTQHQTGLKLSDIDAVMGHYFGVKTGVLVIADSREGNGFLPGDIIKRVNGNDVESSQDALKQLAEDGDALHKVKILRKGRNKTLEVAKLEHSMRTWSSGFSMMNGMHGPGHKKVIIRKIGGPTSDSDSAKRIIIEKK